MVVVEGWLARAAATAPARVALDTPEGSLSYAELFAAARAGAGELALRGAAPGDRVAIALPPGLAFAQALHACFLLGAVAVPCDLRLGPAERAVVCDGAALLLEEPLPERARSERSETSWPAAAAGVVSGDSGCPGGWHSGHDLEAVAAVIHTSGTTSTPRPIELTYGNFLWSALGSAVALSHARDERWLCALPVAHVGGLSILVRSCVYATTAVVHERFETDRVLHALREQDVTLVSVVATTLARLLDAGLTRPPALRCALTGGGPVPAALSERALAAGVPVSLTYGLTEACSQVTTTPVASLGGDALEKDAPRVCARARATSAAENASGQQAGPPLFCTRLRVADDDEIHITGPTVAPGSIAADGWLHTGDLGSLDEHGHLHVTGRVVDTIVSGGENVAPAEVEAALEAHPAVLEAAVRGRPDPTWGEAVHAIVVPRPDVAVEAAALRAHCAARLAHYKVPKQIDFAESPLPRTASGKLLRRAL